MNKFGLLALPLFLLGTHAWAGGGSCDPHAASCKPGFWVDTSPARGAVCRACKGNTISDGCTRSCSACASGTTANASHSKCLPPCPSTLKGKKIPTNAWTSSSSVPGYYAPDSAIVNTGNGQVVVPSASRGAVKSAMGPGFRGAIFTVVGGAGSSSGLPAGVIQCPYDGPSFQSHGQALKATVTINCTGTCAGL